MSRLCPKPGVQKLKNQPIPWGKSPARKSHQNCVDNKVFIDIIEFLKDVVGHTSLVFRSWTSKPMNSHLCILLVAPLVRLSVKNPASFRGDLSCKACSSISQLRSSLSEMSLSDICDLPNSGGSRGTFYWRIQGGAGHAHPTSGSKFFHFHAVFGKNITKQECLPVGCVPQQ